LGKPTLDPVPAAPSLSPSQAPVRPPFSL
jgi:hypothetical protein